MKEPKFYRKFDYDKSLLPNKYLASLELGIDSLEQAKKVTGLTVGYPGWNLLYYSLFTSLRDNEFNTIVETGTNFGCSTIILAQALKDSGYTGHIHSVEIDNNNYQCAVGNLQKSELSDYVSLYNRDSHDFLKEFTRKNDKITFAFLDGNHFFKHVLGEFEFIYNCLDHKSIVFFDNTYHIDEEDGRVYEAIKEIKKKFGGNVINFENTSWHTTGQAIWQQDYFFADKQE